jgi:uncharacterized membrane protein YeiH
LKIKVVGIKYNMTSADYIYLFDMFGTAVFAITGGLVAAQKRLDVFGFMIIGLAPALGGGTIRDMVLGATPVFWVEDPNYVLVALAASLATFFAAGHIQSRFKILLYADAFGLALFAVVGVQKAVFYDVSPLPAVIMSVMTATAGGMVRDVICNEIPLVLRKDIYATAVILGAGAYIAVLNATQDVTLAMCVCFVTTLVLRILAIRRGWYLPTYSK